MIPTALLDAIADIRKNGPVRVLVDDQETCVPPRIAMRDHKVQVDIIFVRQDNWSLGAPKVLTLDAYDLWRYDWIGFIEKNQPFKFIEEFNERDY